MNTLKPNGNVDVALLFASMLCVLGFCLCLQDYYVAGDEKNMLLAATDFCLVPSRFEPCGLVDIEFGWNGALIIGHDTGGLGKMPG